MTPLVLASASPARLETLRRGGVEPEVVVSGVDESAVTADSPAELVARLARLKCAAVARARPDRLVLGCDSVLEFDGEVLGKPHGADVARDRWRRMRGNAGVLHTGHCLRLRDEEIVRSAATRVHFAHVDDAEIDAYVATGEPLSVAGAFTIDGLAGAFVTRIEGDHHNVIGLSLPTLRDMVRELGLSWTDLWALPPSARYTESMTTTIKVSERTRDQLKRQAAEHGRSLGEHLAHLAALADRADRLERLRRAIVEASPDDHAVHRAEAAAWERGELADARDD